MEPVQCFTFVLNITGIADRKQKKEKGTGLDSVSSSVGFAGWRKGAYPPSVMGGGVFDS